MEWNTIISGKTTGKKQTKSEVRTNFQRDYDRLIFSSAFRRLQNKTQIFPLPGSTFVHNRLTHSLEVASVGRSLGKQIGQELINKNLIKNNNKEFYKYELQNVIAAACLAHDIGNPSFGHSGESAISNYFIENESALIELATLKSHFSNEEWLDFITFEGNANSFRILTHQFQGKSEGGYQLTYTTLASILKYPCVSSAIDKRNISTKKYGFFQADLATAYDILNTLNIPQISETPLIYKRHPFVYLTEAADDICYRIVDIEDAQRLGIVPNEQVADLLISLIEEIGRKDDNMRSIKNTFSKITDKNEAICYLRAKCINSLTLQAADLFLSRSHEIINGEYNTGLVDELTSKFKSLNTIKEISFDKIYNHKTVVEIEITGYRIMNDLLSLFVPATLKNNKSNKDEKVLNLIPNQFKTNNTNNYHKVLSILDYLSGMTDIYAIELYRKLFGIEITKHS